MSQGPDHQFWGKALLTSRGFHFPVMYDEHCSPTLVFLFPEQEYSLYLN